LPCEKYCLSSNILSIEILLYDKYLSRLRLLIERHTLTGYTATVATFGDNLKRLREAREPNVLQKDLAAVLGHSNNTTISKWEKGGVLPEPATIRRVAAALGVEPWQLLEGVETEYDRLRAGDVTFVKRTDQDQHAPDHLSDENRRNDDGPDRASPDSRTEGIHDGASFEPATDQNIGGGGVRQTLTPDSFIEAAVILIDTAERLSALAGDLLARAAGPLDRVSPAHDTHPRGRAGANARAASPPAVTPGCG
jgi:transcriptional regulator with XRE-family HTH domain